jgi:hypothetical protein
VTLAAALALLAQLSPAPGANGGAEPPQPAPPAQAVPHAQAPPNITVAAVHGLTLLTVMRGTEAVLWPDPFARPQHFAAHYEEAVTRPPVFDPHKPFMRWDGDPLVVNVVGHGLFGSELYLRARQCRFGWGGSLAFAAATSALWEYAFEGSGVRPSTQDLVYTPLMGIALGEARFAIHRAAGGLARPLRVVIRGLVDPLGEVERAAGTEC